MSSTSQIESQSPTSEERFLFGKNWLSFSKFLTEEKIIEAERSLKETLSGISIGGITFLDVGCGSGLFSLAARRLGARVKSFDYDEQSVSCATGVKNLTLPKDADWTIEVGSILDSEYLRTLGTYDVVYSWGVLHHTGDMKRAFENIGSLVKDGGRLFISIYNDQGWKSCAWRAIKKTYNHSNRLIRACLIAVTFLVIWPRAFLRDLLKHGHPLYSWLHYSSIRGMSAWHDLIDWTGGFPFEVAKPEEVFDFFRARGFSLEYLRTVGGGLGCNEFVFRKT